MSDMPSDPWEPEVPREQPAQPLDVRMWIVSAVIVGTFLIVDFITPRVFDSRREGQWLLAALLGLCIGQVNLIAAWAVLAPGKIVVRLPWAMLLGLAMWYALVMGNQSRGYFDRGTALLLGTCLLVGVVATQIPLWVAKMVFGWRLSNSPEATLVIRPEDRQFNLRHMLLGMFLLSVALSPARAVLPQEGPGRPINDGEMFVVLGAVVVCNLLVTVPCVWGAFVSTARAAVMAFGWLMYCLVLTLFEFGALCLLLGPPGDNLEVLGIFCVMNASQCLVVLGTLCVYRAMGFRMVRAVRETGGSPA